VGAQFRGETRLTPHVPSVPSLEPLDEARLPSRGLAFAGLAVLVLVIGGLGLYGSGVLDPAPSVPQAAAPAATVTDTAAAPAAAPTPAGAAPAAGAAAVAPVAIPTSGPVTLTARSDVWVKIYSRTTGRKAFQGLMVAGSIYKVPLDNGPLVLRAGRAGEIEVSVAGVKLPPLGGSVETVDGVVLTAPALAERFAGSAAAAPPVQGSASQAAPQPTPR
jgi:hypothetical protein